MFTSNYFHNVSLLVNTIVCMLGRWHGTGKETDQLNAQLLAANHSILTHSILFLELPFCTVSPRVVLCNAMWEGCDGSPLPFTVVELEQHREECEKNTEECDGWNSGTAFDPAVPSVLPTVHFPGEWQKCCRLAKLKVPVVVMINSCRLQFFITVDVCTLVQQCELFELCVLWYCIEKNVKI